MSRDQLTDRLPPQNREAERCVLGSMLRDNLAIADLVQLLVAESFYYDAHQKIFRAMVQGYQRGGPVDLVLLADSLREHGWLADCGGYPYLAELWDAAPTAANASHYGKIVRDHWIVRGLIHTATELLREAYEQTSPPEDLLARAEREIFGLAERRGSGTLKTVQQLVRDAYARLDQRKRGGKENLSGVPTGFVDLDHLTAGLQNSELIILAARPSVGKTALAVNIIRHVVIEEKLPVLFVSLEQSGVELAERLLAADAPVDAQRLRKGTLDADGMQRVLDSGHRLHQTKLFVEDWPMLRMLDIAATARRLKLREGIRLIVVDYLQLVEPESRRDPRQEQVAQISRRLKFLAKELDLPVLALAQLNRQSEDRQDKRPRLSDLRESGSIEADADVVMLLHKSDDAGQDNTIEVIVAKQRNGPIGDVPLFYHRHQMRFENHAIGDGLE